jgi:signal transduction histidine kinase
LEAVQNAMKHSGAGRVRVRVAATAASVSVSVVDEGSGFERDAGRGAGLLNMQDRIDAVGGRLTVRSQPQRGTRVDLTVPVPA